MTAYTAEATPAGEARVRADLEAILSAVRREAETDGLLAVHLLGGYAKGEGAVVPAPDGTRRGFNDYDLLLVFSAPPARPERYAGLSARLARELEIDFVDLGIATPPALEAAPPTLFWYEFGEAHLELWRAPGARVSPRRIEAKDLDPEEGSRLLMNRGMALLWAAVRLWPHSAAGEAPPVEDPAELRFAAIAAHKAVTAAGDAALLRAGAYAPLQQERLARLRARPELTAWAGPGFLEAYAAAADYRRHPGPLAPAAVAALWWTARAHHEAGFRDAERARLGTGFADWPDHGRLVRARGRRRLARPREAVRAVKRLLTGGGWMRAEDRFLLDLPGLLYDLPGATPSGRGPAAGNATRWREEAMTAVRRWHP